MNWKLISLLSLFGLAIGVAVVLGVGELWMFGAWLVIRIVCALWLARAVATRLFAHGFLVGFFGAAAAVLMGFVFHATYVAHHPEYLENVGKMSASIDPRSWLALIAFVVGLVHGFVQGFLAWIVGKALTRNRSRQISRSTTVL